MSISELVTQPDEPNENGFYKAEEGSTNEPTILSDLDKVLARIAPLKEPKPYLKGMIYSEPGVGKTSLIGSIPDSLTLDTEQGTTSVLTPGINAQKIPFKSFYQAELLVKAMHDGDERLKNIKTFNIDTVSELHKRGLAETTERVWLQNPDNNRYLAETEHHTENNEHLRRLVASCRDLERNVIITAHARTVEPKGELPKTFPDFSEKLANVLGGMMDFVGYLYLAELDGELKRVLLVRPNGRIAVKTRITTMPQNIVEPTWEKIWDYFVEHNRLVAEGLVEETK